MRKLMLEQLEKRNTMCGPEWLDVNVDGHITPQDALVMINQVNSGQSISDTNCDGAGTPRDILKIINYVNIFGSTTAQNMTVRYVGGVSQIPIGGQWEAWTVRVNAIGHVEFDVALEIETEEGQITHQTPLDMVSIQGLTSWSVTGYSDPRLGTIYRVQGRIDETYSDPLSGLDVRLSLDTTGSPVSKIRGWIVYQNWSDRFNQQLSNEVVLNDVKMFERWWL